MQGLARDAPDVLFIDTTTHQPVDYVRYFSRDPRFVEMLSKYDYFADLGPFRVYRRATAGTGGPPR